MRTLFRPLRYFPLSSPPLHHRQHPRVFFQLAVDSNPAGLVVFELYDNIAPKAVTNFIEISKGVTVNGKKLHYEGSQITKILPFRGIWGGVLGGSIFGRTFPDENYAIKHDRAGILTTANPKINSNDSAFIVTLGPAEWLDKKSVAFGEVIFGLESLQALERLGGLSGVPKKNVTIAKSGVVSEKDYHKYDREEHFDVLATAHH